MRTPNSRSQDDSDAHPGAKIVFSLAHDIVWVSWPGKDAAVELGNYRTVTAMMRDFLDQSDLGERLMERLASDR